MELEIAVRFAALALTILFAIAFLEFENLAYTIANFLSVGGLLTAFGAWIAVIGETLDPRGGIEVSTLLQVAIIATLIGGGSYICVKFMRKFGL